MLSDTGSETRNGRTEHVGAHFESALDHLEDVACCGCSVPQLVVETRELLESTDIDEDRIYTEGWKSDAVDEE